MTWKTEQQHPEEDNNLGNYESAIKQARTELDNLSQSIKEAIIERDSLVSGNNSILRAKLDEFEEREKGIADRRSMADEIYASAHEKNITVNAISGQISEDIEKLNSKKDEFIKSFQEQAAYLDIRDNELIEIKSQLDNREKELDLAIEKFEKSVSEHELKVISVKDCHLLNIGKEEELEQRSAELHESLNRLAAQKLEIFNTAKQSNDVLERVELIKKDIDSKVKEQAELLDINNKKEQSIRDLIIEERRSKIELEKTLETMRKGSNIMQQQKQELEDLKNQIANHEAPKEGEV